MAWPTTNRSNMIAGVFLVAGVALFLVTTAVLGGLNLEETSSYTARFPIDAGVAGLKPGSAVTVGGVEAGRVVGVAFAEAAEGSAPEGIDVEFTVRSDLALRRDARVELSRPLIGTLATLNIRSLGTVGSADGATLNGVIGMPGFLVDAGFGPEEQSRIAGLIRHLESVSIRLDDVMEVVGDRTDPVLADVAAATDNLRSVLERAADRFPVLEEQVTTALSSANALVEDLRETARLASDTIDRVNGTVADLTERIDAIADNTERATASAADAIDQVRDEWIPSGSSALADAAAAAERARTILERERVAIRRIMANMAVVSDQAKLAAGEVRGEPWRLLRRPDTKELSEQLVYDAARAFAQAAGDMREASESLSAVIDPAAPAGEQDAEVEAIRTELATLQSQLAEAGQRLLERLDNERGD